jgi:MFS family permease
VDVGSLQRRTVRTLMVSSAVGYAGYISVAAVVGLLASELVGSDLWAGVPAAAATIGTALAATPLALLAKRRGRRRGIGLGYLLAAVGGGLIVAAGQLGLFVALVVAMLLFGAGQASNLQSRFAAADLADEDSRARSIAMVVWVGTVGAVLGAPAALWANRVGTGLGLGNWVGPAVLGLAGFSIAGAVVAKALRPDPLEVAGGVDGSASYESPLSGIGESWRAIWPNRLARLSILAMAVSQMAMVAVMTMTPLHMRDHGHADLSTLVISIHVLGMFGFSPLVGRWADRLGRIPALGIGAAILGLGTVAAVAAGYVPELMFAGLFLLGLGWSFALIAGSALLTESVSLEARVGAQGFADLAMSLLGAIAAFGSGFMKEMAGFHWLANFATISAILIILAVTNTARTHRTQAV